MIKDINDLNFSKKYTYTDYLNWKFAETVELWKGEFSEGWLHGASVVLLFASFRTIMEI
ncbi:MAG: hypothetical protein GY705_10280 [Bacteroidetes bacterium]|nr:hypothetical protein [Bacteroidota bacterium]